MSVRRIFAEKKEPYAVKAQELMEEMSSYLDIHDAKKVRVLIRYDVGGEVNGRNASNQLLCEFSRIQQSFAQFFRFF